MKKNEPVVSDRVEKAVRFLESHPELCKVYPEGKGFHVRRDARVTKQDGSSVFVSESLDAMGLQSGDRVCDYVVDRKVYDNNTVVFKFFGGAPSADDEEGVF